MCVIGLRSSVDSTATRRNRKSSGSKRVARYRETDSRTGTDCVSSSLTLQDPTTRPSTRAERLLRQAQPTRQPRCASKVRQPLGRLQPTNSACIADKYNKKTFRIILRAFTMKLQPGRMKLHSRHTHFDYSPRVLRVCELSPCNTWLYGT